MKREIITGILEEDRIRQELRYLIDYFSERGHESCEILFGFAWGNDYYPGNEWPPVSVTFLNLESTISDVEQRNIGRLSTDDLFLTVDGLEFLFCHESDIHLSFETATPVIEHFYERWRMQEFQPSEWLHNTSKGHGTRVR